MAATNDRLLDRSQSIAAGLRGPAAARAAVTGWLDGLVSAQVLDDARLLVSELVTNSELHAGTDGAPVRLSAVLARGVLRLEVGDAGQGGEVAVRVPGSKHRGGFGLSLVDTVAERWGVTHAAGTEVWFELACA